MKLYSHGLNVSTERLETFFERLISVSSWTGGTDGSVSSRSQHYKGKGKDVDLYSASRCIQDSSNAHFVTETEPPGRI